MARTLSTHEITATRIAPETLVAAPEIASRASFSTFIDAA